MTSTEASKTPAATPPRASAAHWTGRVLSALVTLFLGWDAALKLLRHPMALEGSGALGYGETAVVTAGVLAALCSILYILPRTAVLGAILWTGYLGGAVATHLRVGNPLLSHTLFPLYVAAFLWGGLALRDPRVLALVAKPRT